MQVVYFPYNADLPDIAASIGFFDGVHRGHKFLISQIIDEAQRCNLKSAVITFKNHPKKEIDPNSCPLLLNSFDEKIKQLEPLGLDYCFVIDFNHKLRELTAGEFIKDVLSKMMNVKKLIIGYDHRFGKDRAEGFEQYKIYGGKCGMEVVKENDFAPDDIKISSSKIRKCLLNGDVREAAKLLGYSYFIGGHVERGHQIGRTIGFPTANLMINDVEKLIPENGVYYCVAEIDGKWYNSMVNIGVRPTVSSSNNVSIEAHVLDYSSSLYGYEIKLYFVERIRNEIKMNSLDELKDRLVDDKFEVKKLSSIVDLDNKIIDLLN
ncbi:MAG: bifunctional riboflavin kinase/FAD synthetase [Bacteroidales bacterium]|nr:bifunctional riboflavin kinase/FAD synthetase [Bacteroidales bacterium]